MSVAAAGGSIRDLTADDLGFDPADCVREVENAYSAEGGLVILYGNLAPQGAVVKAAGVLPQMLKHSGPAVIFEAETDAYEGIVNGKVKAGDVVVIRYEGPKGGPGMQEMLAPTSAIKGVGLDDKVALITDGRFFRRHGGGVYRARQPRGGRLRADRVGRTGRHHRDRHPGPQARRQTDRRGVGNTEEELEATRAEVQGPAIWPSTPRWQPAQTPAPCSSGTERRNPKHEVRNTKQIQIVKVVNDRNVVVLTV